MIEQRVKATIAVREDMAVPKLGRRERSKLEKRNKIVDAAKLLFRTKGFDATTTLEIAERADIGSGTLFLYAPTKDDLLVMVFHDEIMAITRRAIKTIPSNKTIIEKMMHVFNIMVLYHEQDMVLSRIIIKLLIVPPSIDRIADVKEMLDVVHDSISDMLKNGKTSKTIKPDINTNLVAKILFSIYYMDLILWLSGHMDKDQFLAELTQKLKIAIDGIRFS